MSDTAVAVRCPACGAYNAITVTITRGRLHEAGLASADEASASCGCAITLADVEIDALETLYLLDRESQR